MKKIIAASLCLFTLVACGKAEITSQCSLNGRGYAECTFKNSGKVKGSSCVYFALSPKAKGIHLFEYLSAVDATTTNANLVRALQGEIRKSIAENEIDKSLISIGIFENGIRSVSGDEVCSGIVDAGDIRQVTATVNFVKGEDLSTTCGGQFAGQGKSWADYCGFTTISKEEMISILKAKLTEQKLSLK